MTKFGVMSAEAEGHSDFFNKNVVTLLDDLQKSEWAQDNNSLYLKLRERSISTAPGTNSHTLYSCLQRDIVALYWLIDREHDFTEIKDTGFYNIANGIARLKMDPTAMQARFGQLVSDTLKSQKTNGQEPPLDDLADADDFLDERKGSKIPGKAL